MEIAILWSHTNGQTGGPAFGYPAKDQRELAAECRRLMSMLVADKHPLPEISSCAHVLRCENSEGIGEQPAGL